MLKKQKKSAKNKKKFFIILTCYIAVFLVTAIVTTATLSWYSSSTWSTDSLFMGGPVYIFFSDTEGQDIKSGTNQLVTELPPNWDRLYPGMNIKFEAKAVLQGAKFEKEKIDGSKVEIVTTGAVLRAKVLVSVTTENGTKYPSTNATAEDLEIARSLYQNIWPQLQTKAQQYSDGTGKWIFEQLNNDNIEENYFYYIKNTSDTSNIGTCKLVELGGKVNPRTGQVDNVAVGFLDNTTITLSGLGFVNEHADCDIKFTIVFQALQAFFPYVQEDLGTPYLGDTTGRPATVTTSDLGMAKPLTIDAGRNIFDESFKALYN